MIIENKNLKNAENLIAWIDNNKLNYDVNKAEAFKNYVDLQDIVETDKIKDPEKIKQVIEKLRFSN